ncbi:plant cysteine oxidase 3-like isoform X2 [Populus alba x Populus x berolinensis]|nr:plant cysteine oxidase 3-like isoform X2 [Populus alba x Populus x berolinensis]KAJ6868683.1 plant cysteine oxidase 3-like isoform X2 [Populus alba x Populus x berolinensis]
MFSKFRNATDKARKLAIEHQNCLLPFIPCFRNLINMVEQQNSSSKVQASYELCRKTFTPSGAPPSSSAIQKICSLLDTFGPADVGLKEENRDDRGHGMLGLNRLSSVARWAQPITYVDVYECDSFTMCIFCFPTSSVIPLHDHPSMTVFSKVLYGSLHVKAYDWVEPACYPKSEPGYPAVRLAKLTVDKTLTAPCETSVLYPKRGGNLHCFTAVTPCAVLDILTPPYREDVGRKCTYYHDYPFSTFSRGNGAEIDDEKIDDLAWLAEIDTPDDLYMRQGAYTGPAVQGCRRGA